MAIIPDWKSVDLGSNPNRGRFFFFRSSQKEIYFLLGMLYLYPFALITSLCIVIIKCCSITTMKILLNKLETFFSVHFSMCQNSFTISVFQFRVSFEKISIEMPHLSRRRRCVVFVYCVLYLEQRLTRVTVDYELCSVRFSKVGTVVVKRS